jgi:hypothetical protein
LAGRKTDICLVFEAGIASTVRNIKSFLVGKSKKYLVRKASSSGSKYLIVSLMYKPVA